MGLSFSSGRDDARKALNGAIMRRSSGVQDG
jgi:hypothetical protein